jgi:hypothetical protein
LARWRSAIAAVADGVGRVEHDVFISYSRADTAGGRVPGLRDVIYDDFKDLSSEPFRIFFDTSEIHSRPRSRG